MKLSDHMRNQRFVIKVGGESGQGINSVGEILAKAVKDVGYHVFAYREYPSLIRGGVASYQVEFSDKTLQAPSQQCDLLVCSSRVSVHTYLETVATGGQIIHTIPQLKLSIEQEKYLADHSISLEYVHASRLAISHGGKALLANTVLVGLVWQLLQLPLETVAQVVREVFGKKAHLRAPNQSCLQAGYEYQADQLKAQELSMTPDENWQDSYILSGNDALALGAITAGVRAYYAYPMTPASSILKILAHTYKETGILIKQAEDEITAAQLAYGSMLMGTRALTGTSGGGFDLMTETVSLAGMTEVPFVCILAQRPGPATGMPTWTAAGDLNLAIHAGHGEYPRVVLAASGVRSGYRVIQQALNLAETFQIPVIVLTEKQIAESLFNVDELGPTVPIQRGLVPDSQKDSLESADRYKFTASGVSLRWNPGEAKQGYDLNSDEHLQDGSLTEDAQPAEAMQNKRLRKMLSITEALDPPKLYGNTQAKLTFIGWGSPKQTVLDCIRLGYDCNYLHFEALYPLRTELLIEVCSKAKKTVLIEQNAFGQLGKLITQETQIVLDDELLKYDGRPFFIEEIITYLDQQNITRTPTDEGAR